MGGQVTTPRNPFDRMGYSTEFRQAFAAMVQSFRAAFHRPRRIDLDPESLLRKDSYYDETAHRRFITIKRVSAAGHLGVHEVTCPGHLLGVDGGSCLYCQASV
jgi:hypothetical protein